MGQVVKLKAKSPKCAVETHRDPAVDDGKPNGCTCGAGAPLAAFTTGACGLEDAKSLLDFLSRRAVGGLAVQRFALLEGGFRVVAAVL